MKKLNWLHMSDIHYNFANYSTMVMRDATIKYLKSLQIQFDFMIITGDIRYKGEAYSDDTISFIHRILEELHINKNNLFIIPGNHDIKRSPKRIRLIKGIISSGNPSEDVNILDDETYNDLLSGQNEFFEFYKKLTGSDYRKQDIHFAENRDNYNIIHVNTCLISGIDNEDEQKRLVIGQKKLREALQNLSHDVLNIAIGHHSIECLDSREKEHFINTLADCHIDIYLSGHVHKPSATFDINNVNDLLFVSCGSGMCDDFSTVGFITGDLDIESGNGSIAFYKWSQNLEKWVKDNEVSRITSDNIMHINIKKLVKSEGLKKNIITTEYPTETNISDIDVNSFISQLLTKNSINDFEINYSLKKLPIDIPRIATIVSEREDTVNNLLILLTKKTWIHLCGDVWSGKTYLATLTAKKYKSNKMWLGLKGYTSEQAYDNIYEILMSLTGVKPSQYLEQFCEDSCKLIAQDTLMIFDDIPKVVSKLGNFLIKFVYECKKHNIKIITTGVDELPSNIKRTIGETLTCLEIPRFTDGEILDLLQIYKAPESVLLNKKFIGFIAAKTGRNPSLIQALINYLSIKSWSFTNKTLIDIMYDNYSVGLENEIQDLIIETLNDKYERELLYRLAIIEWSFTFEDVKVVSSIAPAIELPMEYFNKLVNLWVIKEENNITYTVSPLVKRIAEKNISLDIKKSVNLAMANALMQRKTLEPPEVLRAIIHFSVAEEFDSAGFILIRALNEMDMQKIDSDEWGFTSLWYDMQLPDKMSLETKLYLRLIQIKYCIHIGKNINRLLEDFDILLEQSNNIGFIAYYMSVILSLEKPQRANGYFIKSVNSLSDIKLPNDEIIELPKEVNPEVLIWVTGGAIKSNEDAISWINTLKQLSHKQLENTFNDKIAEEACFNIVNNIWLQEYKKEKQDWALILDYLTQLTDFAYEKKLELLWACSIRVRIIVLAENQGNTETAMKLAEDSLKIASNSPVIQFIIKSVIGQQLVYKKKYSEAINWLTDALTEDTSAYPIEKTSTLLGLSEALVDKDLKESAKYAKMAVDFYKKTDEIMEYYLVKVLGEYIITLWQSDNLNEAFCPFEEAVNILLTKKKDNDDWKEVHTIFGHVSEYIITLLTTGKPPEKTKDGGPYAPPYRSMFFAKHPLVAGLYDKEMDYALAIHTYCFAEKVSKYVEAQRWAMRAYEMGMQSTNKSFLIANGLRLSIYLINSNKYKEALKISLDGTINSIRANKYQSAENTSVFELITFEQETLNSIKEETEKKMLIYWAIPSLMKLSIVKISGSLQDKEYANEVINECSKIQLIASYPKLWENISDLFNYVFVETKNFNYFINQYNEAQDVWLKIFYCIGAAALAENPKDIIKMQLISAPIIHNEYKICPPMYKELIGNYFKLFWISTLERHESKFIGVGWKVKNQLEKCNYLYDDEAIKKIMGIVISNLDIRVDDKILDWLEI